MRSLQARGSRLWRPGLRRVAGALATLFNCLFIIAGFSASQVHAADNMILIVPSASGGAYVEFTDSLQSALRQDGGNRIEAVIVTLAQLRNGALDKYKPRMIVAVGTHATQAVLASRPGAPVLATLIPRVSYHAILLQTGAGSQHSAIFLDHSIERRLRLVAVALPRARQIAALAGSATQEIVTELKAAVSGRYRLRVRTVHKPEMVDRALASVLIDSDIFLAVADPAISEQHIVRNMLLASYRHRVPVLAYSAGLLRAGATIALYSTPTQLGRHTAELVSERARSGRWILPRAQQPRYYKIGVNGHVARSLGLNLPSEALLMKRMQALESRQ